MGEWAGDQNSDTSNASRNRETVVSACGCEQTLALRQAADSCNLEEVKEDSLKWTLIWTGALSVSPILQSPNVLVIAVGSTTAISLRIFPFFLCSLSQLTYIKFLQTSRRWSFKHLVMINTGCESCHMLGTGEPWATQNCMQLGDMRANGKTKAVRKYIWNRLYPIHQFLFWARPRGKTLHCHVRKFKSSEMSALKDHPIWVHMQQAEGLSTQK